MLKHLGVMSLFAATAWPAGAYAADRPSSAPPSGMVAPNSKENGNEAISDPDGKPPRLVPEQFSTLFKIDDDNPEAVVPTAKDRIGNPLEFGYYIQDLLTRAEVESKRKNQAGVIKYYRALAAALPEEAQGWALLCEAYQTAGDSDRALRACKYAIDRKGVQMKDYLRYVDLIVAKPGDLSREDRDELNAVLAHLSKEAEKQPQQLAVPIAHVRCEAAVKMHDESALRACTAVLAKSAPNDQKTIVFQWSLAVMRGDRAGAATLLGMAEKAGVKQESIDSMSQVAFGGNWWSSHARGVAVLGVVAILLALLALIGYRRRLATVANWRRNSGSSFPDAPRQA